MYYIGRLVDRSVGWLLSPNSLPRIEIFISTIFVVVSFADDLMQFSALIHFWHCYHHFCFSLSLSVSIYVFCHTDLFRPFDPFQNVGDNDYCVCVCMSLSLSLSGKCWLLLFDECFEYMRECRNFFSVLHINDCIVQLHCNVIYFQYVFNAARQ